MLNVAKLPYIKRSASLLISLVAISALVACEHPEAETEIESLDIEENSGLAMNSTENEVLAANSKNISDPTKFGVHSSIVSSDVSEIQKGSPEATLSRALNTLYYGNAKDASIYYQTSMPDFDKQLENTQEAFQKTVRKVNINDVVYNDAKTEATLKGEIFLNGIDESDYAEFDLKKINGVWMLLTE